MRTDSLYNAPANSHFSKSCRDNSSSWSWILAPKAWQNHIHVYDVYIDISQTVIDYTQMGRQNVAILLFRRLFDSRWKSWIVPTFTSDLCLPITCIMWRIMLTTYFSETTLGLVLIGNEPNSQCSFSQPESKMSRPRIFAVFRKLALTCVWKLRAAWPRGECQQNSHGSWVCSGWFWFLNANITK